MQGAGGGRREGGLGGGGKGEKKVSAPFACQSLKNTQEVMR